MRMTKKQLKQFAVQVGGEDEVDLDSFKDISLRFIARPPKPITPPPKKKVHPAFRFFHEIYAKKEVVVQPKPFGARNPHRVHFVMFIPTVVDDVIVYDVRIRYEWLDPVTRFIHSTAVDDADTETYLADILASNDFVPRDAFVAMTSEF